MDFLEEFDKRAEAAKANPAGTPLPPPPSAEGLSDDDKQLLEFADLIRARRESPASTTAPAVPAAPTMPGRLERLKRIQENQERFSGVLPEDELRKRREASWRFWSRGLGSIAAVALLALGLNYSVRWVASLKVPGVAQTKQVPVIGNPNVLPATTTVARSEINDDFAGMQFPKAIPTAIAAEIQTELPNNGYSMRVSRVRGMVTCMSAGQKNWRVLSRGDLVNSGDKIRTSGRNNDSVWLLSPWGSSMMLGPTTEATINSPNFLTLSYGYLNYKATGGENIWINMSTGYVTTSGGSFSLSLTPGNAANPTSNVALVRCSNGTIQIMRTAGQQQTLSKGQASAVTAMGIATPAAFASAGGVENTAWIRALELESNANAGIGELVAKTEKANEHLPLEIASHSVTVTCVEQVARTFVDEVFVNNTDRRLEGTFYYPLPADAAISEFAMFVDGKRIVGEVLEQEKARQVYEYIVRQQKDPALLEWAGGNLFKMRVYPIEPHSEKRVQLGYTQILPVRNGMVTYTYPLYSEKLIKNPLQKLDIEFRAMTSAGLVGLRSTTHDCAVAMDPDGKRGALAFSAKKYTPSTDFSASYSLGGLGTGTECLAVGNVHPDDADPYFMLQIAPQVALPMPKVPERLLVIVDGSASAGAKDYAVASEFAAICADLSANWEFAVIRGGQNPEQIDLSTPGIPGVKTSAFVTSDLMTSELTRKALLSKQPLGATDLIATFDAAAKLAADGRGLQIVYIGDGIDTVNELSASALVERIAAKLGDLNVSLSTVAVGSTYEQGVMQGLANALGGTFSRVQGASDVQSGANGIFENFYRPKFWNAKISIVGINAVDVYPEELGSIPGGESATVFGRIKRVPSATDSTYSAKIFFSADSTDGKIDRSYTVKFEAVKERAQFLPRLWARARGEALTAKLGMGSAMDDAQLKAEITALSVKYQIMSPYTSFLVLDSEEAYAQHGIKRTTKRVDWMGDEKRELEKKKAEEYMDGPGANPFAAKSAWGARNWNWHALGLASDDQLSLETDLVLGDLGDLKQLGEPTGFVIDELSNHFIGGFSGDLDGDFSETISGFTQSGRSLNLGSWGSVDPSNSASFGLDREPAGLAFDAENVGFALSDLDYVKTELYFRSRGSSWGYRNAYVRQSQSTAFPSGTKAQFERVAEQPNAGEFKIDNPLQSEAYYKKFAMRDANDLSARLHWVLVLQANSEFKAALRELQPLLKKQPTNAELKLLEGELLFSTEQTDAAVEALIEAQKLAESKPESKEKRAAFVEKVANLLNGSKKYELAAERFAALTRFAEKVDEVARLAELATDAWDSAKLFEKSGELWSELFKRFPDSAAIKAGKGHWQIWKGRETKSVEDITRGIELLGEAARSDEQFAANWIEQLRINDRIEQARAEAVKFLDSSKSADVVYNLLAQLASNNTPYTIGECKRLLKGKLTSAQYGGVVSYWSNYGINADKEFKKLMFDNLKNDNLTPATRASAARKLFNRIPSKTGAEQLTALYMPILKDLKTPEEFSNALSAAQAIRNYGKQKELLAFAEEILKNPELKGHLRWEFLRMEYSSAQILKIVDIQKGMAGTYFEAGAKAEEKETLVVAQMFFGEFVPKGDVASLANLAEKFNTRFPKSEATPKFYAAALAALSKIKKPEEREAALEALTKRFPENGVIAEFRARSFAQKGKFKEATEILRGALKALPAEAAKPNRKFALLQLQAKVSAQVVTLRDAFLKEAAENEKSQHPVLREWSEAALTCLNEAALMAEYVAALEKYARAEPNDPEWKPRLAAALIEAGRVTEGRAAFEALSDADPENAELAFQCRTIALKQKDEAAAQKFFERAFTAIETNKTKLAEFANNTMSSNPEWALRAYQSLLKDRAQSKDFNLLLNAGNVARDLRRWDLAVDWYFSLLTEKGSYYPGNALNELAALAQQSEELHAMIAIRASGFVLKAKNASEAVAGHLLNYRLQTLKQNHAAAKAELDAAIKPPLPEENAQYLATAVLESLKSANRFADIETYVLSGGGNLERRQLWHTASNYLNGAPNSKELIHILRKLLDEGDHDAAEVRRQLIDQLVSDKNLDEALAEARKNELTSNSWYAWSCWDRVIDGYSKAGQHSRAAAAALEALNLFTEDPSYGTSALQKFCEMAMRAGREKEFGAKLFADAQAAYRSFLTDFFRGESGQLTLNYCNRETEKTLGLESEGAALAKAAEESGVPERIATAAEFADHRENYKEAARLFTRVLQLDPNDRHARERLLDVQMNHTLDWEEALKTLDVLKVEKPDTNWMQNRAKCLGRLKRFDEARVIYRELLKRRDFLRNGIWSLRNLAQTCEENKDYVMAVEIYEFCMMGLRSSGRVDPSMAADFYGACGLAHKSAGEDSKALDCFLRGMSVIPRDDSNYKRVLDAALDHVLKGKSLEQAVKTHENNVVTEGGDKPHLRLAFAEAYKRDGKTKEMLGQLRIAATLLPKDARLWKELTDGYEKLNDYPQALAAYADWAKLDPQNLDVYQGWGRLYELMGQRENAILAWATMAEVHPREAEGYQAYAQKLTEIRMPDRAAAPLRQAVKYRPTEFAYAKQLSEVYQKLFSAEEARTKADALWKAGEGACRKAMVDVPDDPAPWLNLGRFLEAQQRKADARELYARIALRAWPRFRNETVTEAQKRMRELK